LLYKITAFCVVNGNFTPENRSSVVYLNIFAPDMYSFGFKARHVYFMWPRI